MATPIPIIDSHIHLYPASEISTLAWCTPESPLAKQTSIDEYRATLDHSPHPSHLYFKGFVFLETDRKNDLTTGAADNYVGWADPLKEIAWLSRIALGRPRSGEGHKSEDKDLCLGIIPWGPVQGGAAALQEYLKRVKETAGEAFPLIKGFRFLLQDKPQGTGTTEEFIEGLRWLGQKNYIFDLGVDQRSGGQWQLEEAVEIMKRAHEGVPEEQKVAFIINHFCKPDYTIATPESIATVSTHPKFIAWRTAVEKLSKFSKVFMKLSGGFSEMSTSQLAESGSAEQVYEVLKPWISAVFEIFGPKRIMFGSDWPVCTVRGGQHAWPRWRDVVVKICEDKGLSREDQQQVWNGTATRAYSL